MARYVVAVAGAVAGFFIGGPQGAMIGFSLGMTVGTMLFPPSLPGVEGPRLSDLQVQVSSYGVPIPWVWGYARISGNVIWCTDIVEVKKTEEQGGGKGAPSQEVTTYEYFWNGSVAVCRGEATVLQIWGDSKLLYSMVSPLDVADAADPYDYRNSDTFSGVVSEMLYDQIPASYLGGKYAPYITTALGTSYELPSALMESFEGVGNVPGYRDIARVDFGTNMPLADFGNRIPQLSFEVFGAPVFPPFGIRYFDTVTGDNLLDALKDENDPTKQINLPVGGNFYNIEETAFHSAFGYWRSATAVIFVAWQGTYDYVPRTDSYTYWLGPAYGGSVGADEIYGPGEEWDSYMTGQYITIWRGKTEKASVYPLMPTVPRLSRASNTVFAPQLGNLYMLADAASIYGAAVDPFTNYFWQGHFAYHRDSSLFCTRAQPTEATPNWTPYSMEILPHGRKDNVIDIPLGFTPKWTWVLRYGGIVGWDQIILFSKNPMDDEYDKPRGHIVQKYAFDAHYDWNSSYCFSTQGEMWQALTCFPDDGTNYPVDANFRLWRFVPPESVYLGLGFTRTPVDNVGGFRTMETTDGSYDVTPWKTRLEPGGPTGPESIPSIIAATIDGWSNVGSPFWTDGLVASKVMMCHGSSKLLIITMAREDYTGDLLEDFTVPGYRKAAYLTWVDISDPANPTFEQDNGPSSNGYFRYWTADFEPTDNQGEAAYYWYSEDNWLGFTDSDAEKTSKVYLSGVPYYRWFSLVVTPWGQGPVVHPTYNSVNIFFKAKFVPGEAPVIVEKYTDADFAAEMNGTGNWQTTDPRPLSREFLYYEVEGLWRDEATRSFYGVGPYGREGYHPDTNYLDDTALYKPDDPAKAGRWIDHNGFFNAPVVRICTAPHRREDLNLGMIVRDICEACGMAEFVDFNVDDLYTKPVTGYVAAKEMTGRDMIEPLQRAYSFDGVEIDGVLVFRFRDRATSVTIPEEHLGAQADGNTDPKPKLIETRQQEIELPSRVIVKYSEQSTDYQMGAQQARRSKGTQNAEQTSTFELPLTLNAEEAKLIAERSLYQAWIERDNYEFTVPAEYIRYDAGDVVTVTLAAASFSISLTEVNFGADGLVEMKGVAADEYVYQASGESSGSTGGVGSPGRPVTVFPTSSPMDIVFIDGPLLREEDDYAGFYLAAEGTDETKVWPGGSVFKSSNDTDFTNIAAFLSATTMGDAKTALAAPANVWTLDLVNTVRVQVAAGMELTSCSRVDLRNGFNVAYLGTELIAFQTAVPVSGEEEGVYDLSILRRGLMGTEWAAGTHAVGEDFVLCTGGLVKPMTISTGEIGIARYYRPVTSGGGIADVISETFACAANRIKPLAPVRITGERAGDELTIGWTPRARLDHGWRDGVETVVDEAVEAYEIDIMDGATVKRTLTSSTPTVVYSAANQTTDFGSPQSQVTVKVYMISSRVGRGYPGTATI